VTLAFAAALLLAGPPRFLGPPEKKPADGESAAVSAGEPAPVFSAPVHNADAAGMKRFDLAERVGPRLAGRAPVKAVLISFFDASCAASRAELPTLEALYTQYKTHGLEVVSVTADPAALLTAHGVTYPVAIDRDGAIARLYLGPKPQYPAAVLVGPDGKVASLKKGYRGDPAVLLRAEVEMALR
jgi:peroxiredoxin